MIPGAVIVLQRLGVILGRQHPVAQRRAGMPRVSRASAVWSGVSWRGCNAFEQAAARVSASLTVGQVPRTHSPYSCSTEGADGAERRAAGAAAGVDTAVAARSCIGIQVN